MVVFRGQIAHVQAKLGLQGEEGRCVCALVEALV